MRYFKAWWEFYLLHLLYVISGIYIYTLLGPFTLFDPVLGAEIWGYPLMYPYPYPGLHYVRRPLRITQLDKITFCFWEPTKKADNKRMAKQMRSVFIFKYRVAVSLDTYIPSNQKTRGQWPFRSAGKRAMIIMASDVNLNKSCKIFGQENLHCLASPLFFVCNILGRELLHSHDQYKRP